MNATRIGAGWTPLLPAAACHGGAMDTEVGVKESNMCYAPRANDGHFK
jgi:hypothetical protein